MKGWSIIFIFSLSILIFLSPKPFIVYHDKNLMGIRLRAAIIYEKNKTGYSDKIEQFMISLQDNKINFFSKSFILSIIKDYTV